MAHDKPGGVGGLGRRTSSPRAAIGVEVNTVYVHCAKAFRRGRVWDPSSWDALVAPDICEIAVTHFGLDLARADLEASYDLDLANDRPEKH